MSKTKDASGAPEDKNTADPHANKPGTINTKLETNPDEKKVEQTRITEERVRLDPNSTHEDKLIAKEARKDAEMTAMLNDKELQQFIETREQRDISMSKSIEATLLHSTSEYKSTYSESLDLRSEFSKKPGYVRTKAPDEIAYHDAKKTFGEFRPSDLASMEQNTNNGKGVDISLPDGKMAHINNQAELYKKVVEFNKERGKFYDEKLIKDRSEKDAQRLNQTNAALEAAQNTFIKLHKNKTAGYKALRVIEQTVKNTRQKKETITKEPDAQPSKQNTHLDETIRPAHNTSSVKIALKNHKFEALLSQNKIHVADEQAAIHVLAKNALLKQNISAIDFANAYNAAKPENYPEWRHKHSARILRDAMFGQAASGEQERLKKELSKADNLAEKQNTTDIEIATKHQVTQENISVESIKEPPKFIKQREEAVENLGSINTSKIQARPDDLDKRFTIIEKLGSERYYHKNTEQEAFRDQGKKIIAQPDHARAVASDVAKLAHSKGWERIKVTGSTEFRREVWKEANIRGIEVYGYKATEQDKRNLDTQLASVQAVSRDPQRTTENAKIAPNLTPGAIGDTKSVNPVVAAQNKQQTAGEHMTSKPETKREKLETAFRRQPKKEAIRDHPELKGLYHLDKSAKEFALNKIKQPESRKLFVESVRSRGLDTLAKGEKLPEFKTPPLQPRIEKTNELAR